MKNFFLWVAVGVSIGISAQVEAQENAGALAVVAAKAADTAPWQWQFRLKVGQKWLTTSETSSKTTQQLPGPNGAPAKTPSSMESTTRHRVVIEQNVLSNDDKGARVEMIYRELKQSTLVRSGDKVVFDSENPPAAMKGMADFTPALVGARLSYLLTPSGQISDIQGVEEYLKRLNAGLKTAIDTKPEAPALQKSMNDSMAAMLSPEAIKNQIGTSYNPLPKQAVKLGDSWNHTSSVPVMGTTSTQNDQLTFVSRQNGVISIAQQGQFFTDAGAEFKVPLPVARDKATPTPISQLDLQGTSRGELRVDEASGLNLLNRTSQKMEGELVMSGLTGRGSSLTIPMKMEIETVITTEELKTTQ